MLFDVQDLSVDFFTPQGMLHAVRGISYQLDEGEVLGIVGESGSGKSVSSLALMNLLPSNGKIAAGDILYRGRSVFGMQSEELRHLRGAEVSMIFQEPGRSFDPIYSIERTMAEAIRTHAPETSDDEVREKSLRLLREVNVPHPEERLPNFPHQFSGGMLQRVMIAISLASDPKVLIADEPTTALDVTIQDQIVRLLLRLKESRNLSIVFISHDLSLVGSISDRIAVMYGGLIVEQGPSEEVLHHPLFPYSRALLNSIPRFGEHYTDKSLRTIPGNVPNPYRPEPGCPFAPRCPLTVPECTTGIPGPTPDRHFHRCIFPGEKE